MAQHRDYRSGFSDDNRQPHRGFNQGRGEGRRGGFFDQQREEQDFDERSAGGGGYAPWEDTSDSRFSGETAHQSPRAPYDARDYGRDEPGYGRPYRGQYRDQPSSARSSGAGRSGVYEDRFGSQDRGGVQYGYGSRYYGDSGFRGQQGSDADYYSQEQERTIGSRLSPGGYGAAEYSSGGFSGRSRPSGSFGYGLQDRGRQSGFRGRGPKGYQRSDERLKEVICEQLSDDPRLDASEITITVKNGEVTLEGTVNDRSSKYRAEDLVDDCSGVREIHNRLRVQNSESLGQGQGLEAGSGSSTSGMGSTGRTTADGGTGGRSRTSSTGGQQTTQ